MTSIDSIIRSTLFGLGLTIHYYVFALEHGLSCLFELHQDILKQTIKVRLIVDSNGEITLPSDFTNIVRLDCLWGAYRIPLIFNQNLTSLPNLNNSNTQVPYPIPNNVDVEEYGGWGKFYYYINDWGQSYGKNFGGSAGQSGGYVIDRNRNKIYLGGQVIEGATVELEYLSKYKPTTAGTPSITSYDYMVNDYVVAAIKAYIEWKILMRNIGPRNRFEGQNAEARYYNEVRKLRGRLNPMTKAGIIEIVNRNRKLSIK